MSGQDGASRVIAITAGAAERLAAARAWLAAREQPPIVVASTRAAADDLVRSSLEPGEGLFGLVRTTPGQLAAELAVPRLAAAERSPVTRLGAEALVARVVADALESGRLDYFEPVATFPGFPRALARTLLELRLAAVEPARCEGAGRGGPELAALAVAYADALRDAGLADEASTWRAAEESAASAPHPLTGRPLLWLDVAPRCLLEERLYRRLSELAPQVLATGLAGDREGIEALERVLECVAPQPPRGAAGRRLERLRNWVFVDEGAGARARELADDGSVRFVAAAGEGRECVEVARRIHALAADEVPFDAIAVLLRDPETYLPVLEEALQRAEIPAYYSRGTQRPHGSGRAFLALLACAAEDLSAARFAEYLSLGQAPRPDEAGAPRREEVPWTEPDGVQLVFKTVETVAGPPAEESAEPEGDEAPVIAGTLVTPRYWERLIIQAGVLHGIDRWRRRLGGLQVETELQMQGLDDGDDGKRATLERRLRGLRNLEAFALPILEQLEALPGPVRWAQWLPPLRRLATLTLRSPAKVLAALGELEPMGEVGPVPLNEVRRALEERLTLLRTEPDAERYGRLYVGGLDEAAGRAFHTVFLPGVAEGIFPRRAAEDPLLLDAHRRAIDPALADRNRRVERERLLLRVAVGAAEHSLVVSYPTVDSTQGRARVPSFYALDVMRASEGTLPRLDELRRQAAAGSGALLGWPAPEDPQRSIDAAEFDVAYLEPYLASPRRDGSGRARFLLAENGALERSLRARWYRWSKRFSPADGLVAVDGDEALLASLASQRLSRRSYSPTALQTYAVCPYRFLLYALHRLRPREQPVALEQLDPLTRGSLFHDVQYRLLSELRDAELLPVADDNLERVKRVADTTLDRVAAEYHERLAPAIERVWRDEIEGLRTDLRGWLHTVAEDESDWVPTYFEFSFGLGAQAGRDPQGRRDEAVVLDSYRLRGSIDLVERAGTSDRWRVTDHKTGKAPPERYLVIRGGEVLQPLLYAMAAEHHLGAQIDNGRLFFCTRKGGYESRRVDLTQDNRNKIRQLLGIIDGAVERGFLPAAPRDRACEWCDYRVVCGPYEESRVRQVKDRAALRDLEIIRRNG